MSALDFSVIVPFHNAGKYIERCVRALEAQCVGAERYEILMVDNNSTDRSVELVRSSSRVRLLSESEQGSYAARNRGVREARGSIVAFTDPDCAPAADWLRKIGAAMESPQISLVLGNRKFAADDGVLGLLAEYESQVGAYTFRSGQEAHFYGHTNNMAVRLSALRQLGGFKHRQRGADGLFVRRAVREFGVSSVTYADDVVVRHMEIEAIGNYLEKKLVYGRVNSNRELATRRPLSLATRCRLALRAWRRQPASLAETLHFAGALAVGALWFEWERRRRGQG